MTDYRGTFRIDDVSLNTDMDGLRALVGVIHERLPDADVLLAVSPMVHDLRREPEAERGRIFPRVLNAMSDARVFYRVDRCGVPDVDIPGARLASHGLLHVDHRLLTREVQELSILVSCSLVGSKIFVPPFNKYNAATEAICQEHGIELVKWEDGWRHAGHNGFDPAHGKYYLHAHDTSAEWLREWLGHG